MEVIILGMYLLYNDQHIKNYSENLDAKSKVKYNFVKPVICRSGKRKETYAYAPFGFVFLKQLSADGSVGKVCEKMD